MSLVKSPELTPQNLAAHQANARQSQGAATPERGGAHWRPQYPAWLLFQGAQVRQSDADMRQLRFLTDLLMKHKARGKKRWPGDGKAA